MSKTDELRAMRDAKYARAAALRGAVPGAKPKAQPKVEPKPAAQATTDTEPTQETDGLCGHRSMNGRTCTREAGHAAKSHRYS